MEKLTGNVSIWLTNDFHERLKVLANARRRKPKDLANELILETFNLIKFFDNIGFVRLVIVISAITEAFEKEVVKRKENAKPMYFQFEEEIVDRMEKIAQKGNISKSQLVKNLLEVGIEEVETTDKLGEMGFVKLMEKIQNNLKKRFNKRITDVFKREGITEK